ncbi:MAG: metalloregulator ArsR/SmtB family transcription factor [Chloroflexota bacterium]|nr:metalloregulator ArsR/SmtB family transcription factor [Chloroflexota bacterium]
MVYRESGSLDEVFSALADPTRRAIVARLAKGPATVSELAAPFAMSLPAVAMHLRVLEAAGLIASEKAGRTGHCRLLDERLNEVEEWIAVHRVVWERQFDALETHLARPTDDEERS